MGGWCAESVSHAPVRIGHVLELTMLTTVPVETKSRKASAATPAQKDAPAAPAAPIEADAPALPSVKDWRTAVTLCASWARPAKNRAKSAVPPTPRAVAVLALIACAPGSARAPYQFATGHGRNVGAILAFNALVLRSTDKPSDIAEDIATT